MIEIKTLDGEEVSLNPIHIVGVVKSEDCCMVLTDQQGYYSAIETSEDYSRLKSVLEDELYGFERRN